jgi:23S rRNA pseudouridine1911/1915/1917 synthase
VNERDDYSPEDELPSCVIRTVPPEFGGERLDKVLATLFAEHSRSRLQGWLKEGRVRLDGACPPPRHKVRGGEVLEVEEAPEEECGTAVAEDIPLTVVHEDDAILVIDKPAGLVVHPGSGNWSGTLLNALLHHAPQLAGVPRAGIVHRLDKDTSGLLVVAKTLVVQTDLIRQLQARTVSRQYLALVRGQLQGSGRIDAPIGRHPTQRIKMAVVEGGREAVTRYVVRERFADCTLVECALETGRTHQIRVHMAHIGHPLVGDATYASRRRGNAVLDAFPRQALHAWRLGLVHPASGQPMSWESALPPDFSRLLRELRGMRSDEA